MRTRDAIARSTSEEHAFRQRLQSGDSPIQRLVMMLVTDSIKRRASHLRVRTGGAGTLEELHGGTWSVVTPSGADPMTWPRVVWTLKHLAQVRPEKPAVCGAKIALALARSDGSAYLADYDVTYALTPDGAAIVLASVPVSGESSTRVDPATAELVDQSRHWVATARAAVDRRALDEVRHGLRAVAQIASSMGRANAAHSANAWLSAASVAHVAGLHDDAIELLALAIGAGITSARGRVLAEVTFATSLEALERFGEALPHQEAALAAAESLGPRTGLLVHALSDLARGWARAGDLRRAETLLVRADSIAESLLGQGSAFLSPRIEVARLRRARDPSAAYTAMSEVAALADAYGDDDTSENALRELGEMDLARGAPLEAADRLRRALALAKSHPRSVVLHSLLARALGAVDRTSEALAVLQAGASIAREALGATHPERVAIESALAHAERSSPYR